MIFLYIGSNFFTIFYAISPSEIAVINGIEDFDVPITTNKYMVDDILDDYLISNINTFNIYIKSINLLKYINIQDIIKVK